MCALSLLTRANILASGVSTRALPYFVPFEALRPDFGKLLPVRDVFAAGDTKLA